MTCTRLNPEARGTHLYEMGVQKDGVISRVEVIARNRAQAARIAERYGYTVRDCSMVG